ncbi:MAG: efflux RND transporter permease subunit [Bryobacteraceae bacterium]|nr:efflux RND transporter permease subunit [Bryobacteraceae bacterium]
MASFAVRNPYFIVVLCLIVSVVGVVATVRMPVDLFPAIDLPVVVVATFYSGMPAEQIETAITARYERFFTLASNIDHIESRSLTGVSLIKVFFRPGTNADAAVTGISNLALANLRRLPPGTLPPLVFKFDASSLPVCLVTLKGQGLDETALRDIGQYNIRNQIANVPGASVPQPFGGKTRQIMVYVDPTKLAAYQLSPMDVVRAVNEANVIIPAGELRLGPRAYNLYMNNQADVMEEIDSIPLKSAQGATVQVRDIGEARDAEQIQLNVVRVDGQRSAYLPILKQGGDSNTIAVVDGTRAAVANLVDVPEELKADVVFDQSEFVKKAIRNLIDEGGIGLVLTAAMILIFLGSFRATIAVLLSIPLSALGAFLILSSKGESINTMLLGGLALAFSRLIDNSVVVLENIYRYLEEGLDPQEAAMRGGNEMALPVLAATLTTSVVFFPVVFLYGVSRYLFTALALAVVLSLLASYLVAMTVVPLYCARFLKAHSSEHAGGFTRWFNARFESMLSGYSRAVTGALAQPWATVGVCLAVFAASLGLYPYLDIAFFPRTDAGQIVINVKATPGTRIERTESEVAAVEKLVREVIPADELSTIVSNIGVNQDFSAMYTTNAAQHTAFVQVNLKEGHRVDSFTYMDRLRERLANEMPQLSTFLLSGGLVDAILNQGLPTPIDLQVAGSNLPATYAIAQQIAGRIRALDGVNGVYIPQDLDYPSLRIDVDRNRAGLAGLSQREIAQNVVTALTSNQMIAPGFWTDRQSGNDYLLTVQFPEGVVRSLDDLKNIPLHGTGRSQPTRLGALADVTSLAAPTEVDRYQLRRVIDVYVGLAGEDLGRVANGVEKVVAETQLPPGVRVTMRGMVEAMRSSFSSFGFGLLLSLALLYLILVAQFRSFSDPLLILLAVPLGLTGVLATLAGTGTSLNVMSLMGVVMMSGIVVSNSILIVDLAHRLREERGVETASAIELAARTRLRPILMTSLATIIGLMPMALKLGEGSESYAPLARAIIGGLTVSLVFTVFLVPAAYLLLYRRRA